MHMQKTSTCASHAAYKACVHTNPCCTQVRIGNCTGDGKLLHGSHSIFDMHPSIPRWPNTEFTDLITALVRSKPVYVEQQLLLWITTDRGSLRAKQGWSFLTHSTCLSGH